MNRARIFSAVAALSLVMAACGGGADTTTTAPAGDSQTPATTSAPATTAGTETPGTTTAPATTMAPATTSAPKADNAELAAFYAAIAETTEINSAQMEGKFTIVGAEGLPSDQPLTMGFSGAFDNTTGDYAMSIDLGGMLESAAGLGEEIPPEFADMFSAMEIRQIGDTAYINFPFITMFLGVDTEWLSVPAEESDDVSGFTGGFVPTNPTDMLASFEGVDATIEDLGRETIRGAETTHYRVTVDAAALAESDPDALEGLGAGDLSQITDLPIHFWIDDDGLLHKFEFAVDGADVIAEPGEEFESMVVTFEIYGYNEPVSIEAPDPATVTDADDLGDMFDL